MSTFNTKVVTPDGEKYRGTPQKVVLKTLEGELGILAHHTDYVAAVKTCIVRITEENGEETEAVCGGGFLTVDKGELTVVCNTFELSREIDIQSVEKRIADIRARLDACHDKREKDVLKTELFRLELKEKIAQN